MVVQAVMDVEEEEAAFMWGSSFSSPHGVAPRRSYV